MASGLVFPISAEYNNKGVTEAQQSFARFSSDVEQKLGAATQVANKNIRDLDSTLKTASGSADQSRQVFGAFAGQATQQATMLAGNLGPVGAVLGQIVNQASQVKLTVAGFAQVAGPIAAISAGFVVLKTVMGDIAARAKYQSDLLKSLISDLAKGLTIQQSLLKSQTLEKGIEGYDLFARKVKDLSKDFNTLGLKVDQVNAVVAQGKPAVEKFLDALSKGQRIVGDNYGEFTKFGQAFFNLRFYMLSAAEAGGKAGDTLSNRTAAGVRDVAAAAADAIPPGQGFADVIGKIKSASDDAARAQKELVDRIDESQRALRAALDPIYGNERAQIALQKAEEAYLKAKPNDKAGALLALKQAALDAADAAAKLAESGPGSPDDRRAKGVAAITAQYQELADFFKNNPQLSRYFGNVPGAVGGATRQSMVGFNIAGPAGSYAAATPGTTVTSNNTANVNTVINVNGAYDPVMVAAQLRRLLLDDAIRRGLKNATANSWILT